MQISGLTKALIFTVGVTAAATSYAQGKAADSATINFVRPLNELNIEHDCTWTYNEDTVTFLVAELIDRQTDDGRMMPLYGFMDGTPPLEFTVELQNISAIGLEIETPVHQYDTDGNLVWSGNPYSWRASVTDVPDPNADPDDLWFRSPWYGADFWTTNLRFETVIYKGIRGSRGYEYFPNGTRTFTIDDFRIGFEPGHRKENNMRTTLNFTFSCYSH